MVGRGGFLWGILILKSAGAEMQMCLLMGVFTDVCTVSVFLNVLILHLYPPTEHRASSVHTYRNIICIKGGLE